MNRRSIHQYVERDDEFGDVDVAKLNMRYTRRYKRILNRVTNVGCRRSL